LLDWLARDTLDDGMEDMYAAAIKKHWNLTNTLITYIGILLLTVQRA